MATAQVSLLFPHPGKGNTKSQQSRELGPPCPIWRSTKESLCPSTPTPAGFLRDPQPPSSTEHPRKTPTSSSADASEAPPFRIAAEATARTAPPRKALEENAEYLAPEWGDRG